MNGKLAKEERRNLLKAMGETATDALERARTEVLKLRMEHAALAATLQDEVSHQKGVEARLDQRIDGASAWCEKNEQAIARARQDAHTDVDRIARALIETSVNFAERMNSVINGGFWARLRWALFGRVPYEVEREKMFASVRGDTMGQQGADVAPSQVVIE